LKVEYPGAIDHFLDRGTRREPIFKDDLARRAFVEALLLLLWQHSSMVLPKCL